MEKRYKWYLQVWFICLLFALWPAFGISLVAGIILLVLRSKQANEIAQKYDKIDNAEQYYAQKLTEGDRYLSERKQEAGSFYANKEELANKYYSEKCQAAEKWQADVENLKKEAVTLKKQLESLQADAFVEQTTVYVDEQITSEEYKNQLSILKSKETEYIKSNKALVVTNDGSKKIVNDNMKQILRCFNAEAENVIASVTAKNIDTIRNKISKAFETLNTIFKVDGVALTQELLEMKLEQLRLLYSYQLKKEQEKEEQKAIREQMLEEEKVRREIEKEKAKLEKEETQFKNEVSKLMKYMQKADDIEKQLYFDKIQELEGKLKLLEKDKENVLEREQNTRAGFVYVISNIGSFGEDVYKIGMTRRLEPMDRVKELGDASVPFEFDVHAMIFSEDAPTLENTLHKIFRKYEVNKVNQRKEFFKVPIKDIEKVVTENHNATVTFTEIAKAEQYRQSLRMADESIA